MTVPPQPFFIIMSKQWGSVGYKEQLPAFKVIKQLLKIKCPHTFSTAQVLAINLKERHKQEILLFLHLYMPYLILF